MGSQQDLDQGGTYRLTGRTYMGPSVGWISSPASVVVPIVAVGTTTIVRGITLITVDVNGDVTIQLPSSIHSPAGAQALPGTFLNAPLTIVDIGGFAAAHPITILPFGSELIDGLASISLQSSFGAYVLQPDVANGGWILTQ